MKFIFPMISKAALSKIQFIPPNSEKQNEETWKQNGETIIALLKLRKK